jgi:hypothetical protein
VWFEVLFGISCVGNTYRPDYPLAEERIAALQEAGVWLEPVDFEGLPLATYTSEPDALTREEKEYLDSLDFSVFGGPFHYDY